MFKGLIIGVYLPGTSSLHKMDPRSKVIALIFLIILLFVKTSYVTVIENTLFLGSMLLIAKIPFRSFLKGIKPILLLASLTLVIHLFLTPGTPLISIGRISVTSEGLEQGVLIAARLIFLIGYSTV